MSIDDLVLILIPGDISARGILDRSWIENKIFETN